MTPRSRRLCALLVLALGASACARAGKKPVADETHAPLPPSVAAQSPSPVATPDPFQGTAIEPANERVIAVSTESGDRPMMPEWADVPLHPRAVSGVVPDLTFSQSHTVAVGVAGAGRGGRAPGVEVMEDCIELRSHGGGGRLEFLTWHTNGSLCRWQGEVASASGDSVVAIQDSNVRYTTLRGQDGVVEGCRVRAQLSDAGITLDRDWPPGCTRYACGPRGKPIGRSASIKSSERCADFARRVGERFIPALIGEKPDWAKAAADGEARARVDFGGVWSDPHLMKITSEGAHGRERVVDQLKICREEGRGLRYAFQNFTINGHSCALVGSATVNAAGELLLIGDEHAQLFVDEIRDRVAGPPCHIRVARQAGRLRVLEAWPENCYGEECGAEAAPDSASFSERRRTQGPCRASLEAEE